MKESRVAGHAIPPRREEASIASLAHELQDDGIGPKAIACSVAYSLTTRHLPSHDGIEIVTSQLHNEVLVVTNLSQMFAPNATEITVIMRSEDVIVIVGKFGPNLPWKKLLLPLM